MFLLLKPPYSKAKKDAYLKVVFKDDKDLFKIILFTDQMNGCDYSTVMEHVRVRQPWYTLRNLLEHMFESKNHDLVKMLADEIRMKSEC